MKMLTSVKWTFLLKIIKNGHRNMYPSVSVVKDSVGNSGNSYRSVSGYHDQIFLNSRLALGIIFS